jgi:hypothetical protein
MKGKHIVSITSRRAEYRLELERKITVIKGKSGTGKSSVIRLVSDYLELGKDSGIKVTVSSSTRLLVLTNSSDWDTVMPSLRNTIIFFDEDVRYIYNEAFQKALWTADCYAVIISRSGQFTGLPFAVSSIYELVTERNGKNTITSMYHLYEEKHKRNDFDLVVTEDSNSGYEMAKYAFDSEKMRVISAGGNASVYRTLMKNGGENDQICVDVDGAAFGPYIEPVLKFAELQGTISVSAPESFEFILLHLDSVMKHLSLDHGELSRTYDFCDSKDFITWERYYENLLNEITTEHLGFSYGKSKLNPYFLNGRCAELFIEQICKSFIKRRE